MNNFRSGITNKLNKVNMDMLVGVPLITQVGNKRVIIENYKSVIGFLEYEVKINTSLGLVKVVGEKMIMTEMTSETIIIEGEIFKVEIV